MGKQGKLPLDKEEARLKLEIDSSANVEADAKPETSATSEEQKSEEPVSNDTSVEEVSMEETQYTSAEELGRQSTETQHQTLGENLRHERERQGMTLHDVAEQLRLRPKQIEALENGDYDSLPGHTFVAGFLRSYANLLRLDAVAIVELYKSESQIGSRTTELAFPEPTSEGRIPGSGLILVALFLGALIFAGWFFYLDDHQVELEQVANLPGELLDKITGEEQVVPTAQEAARGEASEEVAKPEIVASDTTENADQVLPVETVSDAPASQILAEVKETGPAVVASAPAEVPSVPAAALIAAEENPAISEETSAPVMAEAPKVEAPIVEESKAEALPEKVAEVAAPEVTAPAAPVAPAYPQSTLNTAEPAKIEESADTTVASAPTGGADLGVENSDSRILLVAVSETWVQVVAGDGEVLFDNILGAGDSYMLPNRADMKLSTANAGGIEVRLDGQSVGMLGLNGVIVQSMPVTEEGLLQKIGTSD